MNNTTSRRVVGKYAGAAIVISNMIGTGIFTTTGLMAGMGARGGDILLAWLIGGILALFGALCYGELGANMPESGGEYYYISRMIHPSLGFLSGWVSLIVGFSAPIAAAAMAMQIYLQQIMPDWPVKIMTAFVIILLSVMHAYDLRLGARVQVALVILKIIIIIGFVTGVMLTVPVFDPGIVSDITADFWFSPSSAVVLIFVAFAYFGWNAASYIGAEIRKPEKYLPFALVTGTISVTFLYVLLNYAYLSAAPVEKLADVESIAHTAATALWGPKSGSVISFLIAAGLISTVSAMIITGPRVYEAMANDGLFPVFFARLNKRGVPSTAVALQAVIAVIIALTSSFGSLLVYIGFTLNIFAILAVVTVFRARKQNISSTRICRGYPVTPFLFIIFAGWMTVWSIQSQPVSTLTGLGTLLAGYAIYRIFKTRKENLP